MDERLQHPHHHGQQAAQPAAAGAPWPGVAHAHAAATPHAPVAQADHPVRQQFQYADAFVLPGASSGHSAPMSAHDGTIGMATAAPRGGDMPLLAGAPQVSYAAPNTDPYAQPQAWGFPTPHGLQLVQAGPAHPPHGAVAAAAPRSRRPGAVRSRVRWETLVPAAAIACLAAAVALFVSDFDRITGRASTGEAASSRSAADAPTDDTTAVMEEATELFEAGRFADAANMLHPLLEVDRPDPRLVELHDRVDATAARNDALLALLQRQRRAGDWAGVSATITRLEAIRPLSPDLLALRRRASGAAGRRAAPRQADDPARRAAPSRPGPRRGRQAAPPAGGQARTSTRTDVRPPADVPRGAIPARPDAPNPISNPGAGASAVGGAAGTSCHSHDGITECH